MNSLQMSQQEFTPVDEGVLVKDAAIAEAPQDRSFRLQAKNLFFTWPQCEAKKEEVLERIKALPNICSAIVCEEDHNESDGRHLHAVIMLSQQWKKRGFTEFDRLAGQHGDYKACRSISNSIRYVMKDGCYVSFNLDTEQYKTDPKEKKETKSAKMAEMIKNGGTLDTLDQTDAGWVMMNKRKAEEYMAWQNAKRMRASLQPLPAIDLDSYVEGMLLLW